MKKSKLINKLGLLCITAIIATTSTGVVFANESSGLHQLSSDTFALEIISPEQVPSGVVPMEFDSQEEAIAYINNLNTQIDSALSSSQEATNEVSPYATYGNTTVATQSVGGGTVGLKLNYKTSLDGNRGTIEYANPYTDFTGFTLAINWNQASIGSDITSSGKDVYAYTSGTIEYYLIIDGLIQIHSRPINLSGTVAIIR